MAQQVVCLLPGLVLEFDPHATMVEGENQLL